MTATIRTGDDHPPAAGLPWIRVTSPKGDAEVARDLARVQEWLRSYVSRPEPRIGRSGPICPFIPPALDRDTVEFSLRYDVADPTDHAGAGESLGAGDAADLGAVVRDAVKSELSGFAAAAEPPPSSGTSLRCRIVVFPELGRKGWPALDTVYESLKNTAVAKGLMTGQFHPQCDERAARNPAFRVSVSPVAVYAVRWMAPHDVLFLHERPEWFTAYDRRFRDRYERDRIRDPLLRQVYADAVARHGLPAVEQASAAPADDVDGTRSDPA